MLYTGIISVCSDICIKPVNELCGQNVELLSVKPGGIQRSHWALKCYNEVERMPKAELSLNLLATDFFFQILAHPVFKM